MKAKGSALVPPIEAREPAWKGRMLVSSSAAGTSAPAERLPPMSIREVGSAGKVSSRSMLTSEPSRDWTRMPEPSMTRLLSGSRSKVPARV